MILRAYFKVLNYNILKLFYNDKMVIVDVKGSVVEPVPLEINTYASLGNIGLR